MVDLPKYDYSLTGRGYERIPGTIFIQPTEETKEKQSKEGKETWEKIKVALGGLVHGLNPAWTESKEKRNLGKGKYGSYLERLFYEPYDFSLEGDSFADFLGKTWFQGLGHWFDEGEQKDNPVLAAYKKELAGGTGAGGGSGAKLGLGVSFPAMPKMGVLPDIDYSALRDKIKNIDVDTDLEVPQHNWLTAFGQALANVDLTRNLAGDWSKAAKVLADFDKERNHDEAQTRNQSKKQKAELEMWKAMKEIALQEAEQNQAFKKAELGLRNWQLQTQAALQQAKANAYYGGGFGAGGWTGGDKTKEARVVGGNASLIDIMDRPSMTMQQAAKKAKRDAMTLPQKDQIPYILGYMQQYAAAKGSLAGEGD